MRLTDIFALMEHQDEEDEHWEAKEDTGFYGGYRGGAGSLPLARDTGRLLISYRSEEVDEPFTWGTWGGAMERDESPQQTALRELDEEAGYNGPAKLIPLYVYTSGSYRYSNYLALIDREFTPPPHRPHPQRGWETAGYRWCEFGDWPAPLHFGLDALLHDAGSVRTIERVLRSLKH